MEKRATPQLNAKLTTIGGSKGFVIPKWFRELWGLKKDKTYKVTVEPEAIGEHIKPIVKNSETNGVIPIET